VAQRVVTDEDNRSDPGGRYYCDACGQRFMDPGKCGSCTSRDALVDLGDLRAREMIIAAEQERNRERRNTVVFSTIALTLFAVLVLVLAGVPLAMPLGLLYGVVAVAGLLFFVVTWRITRRRQRPPIEWDP
jgi:hypothetical protein